MLTQEFQETNIVEETNHLFSVEGFNHIQVSRAGQPPLVKVSIGSL
jgi:hypothetical protein